MAPMGRTLPPGDQRRTTGMLRRADSRSGAIVADGSPSLAGGVVRLLSATNSRSSTSASEQSTKPRASPSATQKSRGSRDLSRVVVIELAEGICLRYERSALTDEEWMVEFDGEENSPGFGCSTEAAAVLVAAANGSKTKLSLDIGEYTPESVEELLAERARATR